MDARRSAASTTSSGTRRAARRPRGRRRPAEHAPRVVAPTGVNTDPGASPTSPSGRSTSSPPRPARVRRSTAPRRRDTPGRDVHRRRAHDGHGFGEAANDDGSGTAIVMELARIFSAPDVKTERLIRFILGTTRRPASMGVAPTSSSAPRPGQGGSARLEAISEPRWLGMIQHDMMLFDHGMPCPDGTRSRPAARGGREYRIPGRLRLRPSPRSSR